jgi:hypothetical protein
VDRVRDDWELMLELECLHCDYETKVWVREADYIAWHNGQLIQESFPYLSDSQRELMISATCNECWNKFFPDED